MTSFEECTGVEAQSMALLEPWIRKLARSYAPIHNFDDQVRLGDVSVFTDDQQWRTIECKAERRATGNFFFETWSNRTIGRRGWIYTLQADVLLYHFLDADDCYMMSLPRVQSWFRRNEGRWRERRQGKYHQHNDTWGCCPKVAEVEREVGLFLFHPVRQSGYL